MKSLRENQDVIKEIYNNHKNKTVITGLLQVLFYISISIIFLALIAKEEHTYLGLILYSAINVTFIYLAIKQIAILLKEKKYIDNLIRNKSNLTVESLMNFLNEQLTRKYQPEEGRTYNNYYLSTQSDGGFDIYFIIKKFNIDDSTKYIHRFKENKKSTRNYNVYVSDIYTNNYIKGILDMNGPDSADEFIENKVINTSDDDKERLITELQDYYYNCI